MGCTTLVAVPPTTKDGEIYLLWNFDILRPAKLIFDRFRFYFFRCAGAVADSLFWWSPGWQHFPAYVLLYTLSRLIGWLASWLAGGIIHSLG